MARREVLISRIEVEEQETSNVAVLGANERVVEAVMTGAAIEEDEADMRVHEAAVVAVLVMIAIEAARILTGEVSKMTAEAAEAAEVALVAREVSTKASTGIHLNRQVCVFK